MQIELNRMLGLTLACSVSVMLCGQTPEVGGGVITTVAGTGIAGFNGDGPGTQATLSFPFGTEGEEFGHIAVDAAGNLYIADKENNRIRKLDTQGRITTIAGTGAAGFRGDGGPATIAQLNYPTGVAVDRSGNVYFTDQENVRVRRIDTSGNITTVAGNGVFGFGGDGGPALSASLGDPSAVAVDAAGNLYIADYLNDRVRMVSAQTGLITTIAGNGQHGDDDPGRDGVPATSIRLGYPSGVLVDAAGNLFIADYHNSVIRVVNLQTGLIRRIAGTGRHAGGIPSGDGGPATAANLDWPIGMALDATGNLFFADSHNGVIRKISSPLSPGPVITSPVGRAQHGFAGDGLPASQAVFDYPAGIAIDGNGNLYIVDWHNQRVRKAAPAGGIPRPEVSSGGVVNGAGFAGGAALAPGSIISIFGQRLAPATATASVVPLPVVLPGAGGASVRVTAGSNTLSMPLFFASPQQINAQLPVELPSAGTATVVVRVGDIESAPVTVSLAPGGPGIFTHSDGRAVAVNQDGKLNLAAEGAARGSVITVYLTGQGELRPPVPTGEAASLTTLSRAALDAGASIGGVAARLEFLGAAPGWVGLAQANITVPDNAPTGDQPLVITVGGRESNRPLITIK